MLRAISAQNRKWEAESDVNTLTEAGLIKQNPLRLKAAKVAAKRMVKEQQKVTKMTGGIANSNPKKATVKKAVKKAVKKKR